MGKRFNSGTRQQALRRMAECAIRDRRAMIDALTQPAWNAHLEDKAEIESCKREIEDFKRLARAATPNVRANRPARGPLE